MLDIAFGEASTSQAVGLLLTALRNLDLNGTLYIGYPLLNVADERIKLDALLTCQEHGVVAFDLSSEPNLDDGLWNEHVEQLHGDIFVGIENKLREHRELRKGRRLAFDVHIITLVPSDDSLISPDDALVASPNRLPEVLKQFPPLNPSLIEHVNAAIQTTTTLKPKKKRVSVKNPTSKGSSLKLIERQIANLDRWQKKAAIEFPENPQRIRGLAGSGKTIVLAQKAALLHAKFPEWNILITFNTRSLYQQFETLVRKFCFELIKDDPDWTKLRISHAWGSLSMPGVYSEIARANGSIPRDFSYAKAKFGTGQSFAGVCGELLHDLKNRSTAELFDVVLIDEAQDFPTEFFQIIYTATKSPKRIVWAYDELQNLGDYTMPPAEVLFGNNPDGTPKVRLQNWTDQPLQDIILRVCYRNTPWALATAHALGFGIYRTEGLVQMFDEAALWNDIGYTARSALRGGKPVSLARSSDASPSYFLDLMTPADAVVTMIFDTHEDEASWIAGQIKHNIDVDELEHDDILVIVSDPLSVRSHGATMMRALKALQIDAHLAGVTASRDALFFEKSIAITSIHRAKGNEAPMVYVLGAESCYRGWDLSRKRNILFTAITRSRAWVRICGVGDDMQALGGEITGASAHDFRLEFRYPTEEEIRKLKRIHRDRSEDEKASIARDVEGVERLIRLIEDGEISVETLPERVQSMIRATMGGNR